MYSILEKVNLEFNLDDIKRIMYLLLSKKVETNAYDCMKEIVNDQTEIQNYDIPSYQPEVFPQMEAANVPQTTQITSVPQTQFETISSPVALPLLIMKLACFSETFAPPIE